jgi:DNA-binding transcriptional regulator YhcF (GntR family)
VATIQLDPALADAPLHQRIAAAVRHAVSAGEFPIGARLPTAQGLAEQLAVNVNTVLRAYRELSAEGLVELRRGRGAVVVGGSDQARFYELADQLLAEAARLGVTRAELIRVLMERS